MRAEAAGCRWAARWRVSGSLCPLRQFAREKIADDGCDLGRMAFEREMPGFEEVDLGVWIIPLEGLRPGRQEERIVLAPYRKDRRTPGAEVVLEFGIERDVALIIAEQVELNLVIAGAAQRRASRRPVTAAPD